MTFFLSPFSLPLFPTFRSVSSWCRSPSRNFTGPFSNFTESCRDYTEHVANSTEHLTKSTGCFDNCTERVDNSTGPSRNSTGHFANCTESVDNCTGYFPNRQDHVRVFRSPFPRHEGLVGGGGSPTCCICVWSRKLRSTGDVLKPLFGPSRRALYKSSRAGVESFYGYFDAAIRHIKAEVLGDKRVSGCLEQCCEVYTGRVEVNHERAELRGRQHREVFPVDGRGEKEVIVLKFRDVLAKHLETVPLRRRIDAVSQAKNVPVFERQPRAIAHHG